MGMRSGASSVQHLLSPAGHVVVLKHAVTEARWRGQLRPPHTFARLHVRHPSFASEWNLQVTVAVQPPRATFLQRFSCDLQQPFTDQQALNSLPVVRGSSPMVASVQVTQGSRYAGNSRVTQRCQCCADCNSELEEERRQLRENESLSQQIASSKCLPSNDEVTSGGPDGDSEDFSVNQDGKRKTLFAEEIGSKKAKRFQTSTTDSVTSPVAHINLKQVGKGSSATIYEALWKGRRVAKKVFDGLDVPDFEREMKVLTGLEHPNIISLLHSGKEKAKCFILMDLMDADLVRYMYEITLNKTGDDPRPFTVPEAMDLMLQVAHGMQYLHANKIVHRDLKAGNILVKRVPGTGLVARVCDFGLAIVKDNTVTYSELEPNTGTNRWIAPELIKFHSDKKKSSSVLPPQEITKLPFKSDVYSFAMVCYEILTGTVPFPAVGAPNVVKRMVQNGKRPELPKHCPPELKALIKRCWRHDPKQRPEFGEICDELKRLRVARLRSWYSW